MLTYPSPHSCSQPHHSQLGSLLCHYNIYQLGHTYLYPQRYACAIILTIWYMTEVFIIPKDTVANTVAHSINWYTCSRVMTFELPWAAGFVAVCFICPSWAVPYIITQHIPGYAVKPWTFVVILLLPDKSHVMHPII